MHPAKTFTDSKPPPKIEVWEDNFVLSLKGFPLSSTIKTYIPGVCSCGTDEVHQDIFTYNNIFGKKCLRESSDIPTNVKICWNTTNLFEDKLPRKVTKTNNRIEFSSLPTVGKMCEVLMESTYWFRRLSQSTKKGHLGRPLRRMYQLLSGIQDGQFGTMTITQILNFRPSKEGVFKLKNILYTVDGFCSQVLCAMPDCPELQNWKYFDGAIHSMIVGLLEDYYPGTKKESFVPYYKKLKDLRGQIKLHGFCETSNISTAIEVDRSMTFMRPILNRIGKEGKTLISVYRVGILCQSRAAGLPPPMYQAQSFAKFKKTVTTPVAKHSKKARCLIKTATVGVWATLAGHAGDELLPAIAKAISRAKISLSDSGELNVPQKEGGKQEAARQFLHPYLHEGKVARYVNLHTGADRGVIEPTPEHFGEILFYESLRKFRDSEEFRKEIMQVRYCGVCEPGKVRGVTVAHLCHAILLHPASHITLDVLKLVPSSNSGLGAAAHSWNVSKRLTEKNPAANFIFRRPEDIVILSSDLEEATDYTNPDSSRGICSTWMGPLCMGFPEFYKRTCTWLLSEPRTILVPKVSGISDWKGKTFQTTRGLFMGDPMCKTILHLHHLIAKEITFMRFRGRPTEGGEPFSYEKTRLPVVKGQPGDCAKVYKPKLAL